MFFYIFFFSLHLDDLSESEVLLDDSHVTTVRLPIIGMTCQSCVKNIESNISTKLGIHRIRVMLAENAGYIDFDPSLTDVRTIASHIDDMGFECVAPASTNDQPNTTTRIHIVGMTCQSCVRSIEERVGAISGVNRIVVSLAENEAQVDLDASVIGAAEVAAIIEDMGFEATVMDCTEQLGTITRTESTAQKGIQFDGVYFRLRLTKCNW